MRAIHPSKDLNRYIVDKFHQPTAKSKAAPFEAIDLSIYKPSARCLAFSTSEDRLLLWIVAFQFRYYEITGNGTDYTVIWEEQDNPSSTSKCDKICIHLSMNTSTGEEKLVTITVFGTTGRILVQGKKISWMEQIRISGDSENCQHSQRSSTSLFNLFSWRCFSLWSLASKPFYEFHNICQRWWHPIIK